MKQNKKLFVAITGGIGSGKSTVLAEIAALGYPTFSADAVAKTVYERPKIRKAVLKAFPECTVCGGVDRKKLAQAVFPDSQKLALLNSITHPYIMEETFRRMRAAEGKVVFAEIPLLFEGGYERMFDRVIVVMRGAGERVRSVVARDGLTEKQVTERMQNQIDYEKFPLSAHTVLYNDGDLPSLKRRVAQIVEEIVQ